MNYERIGKITVEAITLLVVAFFFISGCLNILFAAVPAGLSPQVELGYVVVGSFMSSASGVAVDLLGSLWRLRT